MTIFKGSLTFMSVNCLKFKGVQNGRISWAWVKRKIRFPEITPEFDRFFAEIKTFNAVIPFL